MKRILLYFLFLPFMIQGQNTVILDPNFEQALIDLGIDKDVVDGLVPTASVSNISYLNISHKNIVDLTGAGDLFAAGFLHGFTNNKNPHESLKLGTEMASKIIQKIGARLD